MPPKSSSRLSPPPQAAETPGQLEELEVDLTPEQQSRINRLFAALSTLNLYELLGVTMAADEKTIKSAFEERVMEFHPDRFFRKRLGSFKPQIEAICARLTEAHDRLCSSEHRAKYDAVLRTQRTNLVQEMLEQAVVEMAGATQTSRREWVLLDGTIHVKPTPPTAPSSADAQYRREVLARRLGANNQSSRLQPARPIVSAETVAVLRDLHERSRRQGGLQGAEGERYALLREQFARAFLGHEQLDLPPGQTRRQAMRVPCAFRLVLSLAGRIHNTLTVDLSTRGLAALVGSSLPVHSRCEFVLQVASAPIRGYARVIACPPHGVRTGAFRVSLEFEVLDHATTERLEILVLDVALQTVEKTT